MHTFYKKLENIYIIEHYYVNEYYSLNTMISYYYCCCNETNCPTLKAQNEIRRDDLLPQVTDVCARKCDCP